MNAKVIEPTVGRIVYYYEAKAGSGHNGAPTVTVTGPLAAHVTRVWSSTCVNVAVQNADGAGQFGRTSVRLLQPGEHRPETGQWVEWMPYQIAQTIAAEALHKAVDSAVAVGTISAGFVAAESNAPTREGRPIGFVPTNGDGGHYHSETEYRAVGRFETAIGELRNGKSIYQVLDYLRSVIKFN